MSGNTQKAEYLYNTEPASNNFTLPTERIRMPQITSELVVLTFIYEYELPLQPKTIYGGLISKQDITFSYRTVQNKVAELYEKGDIKKVKIDKKEGKIADIPPDEDYRRAYYMITEQGKERVEEEVLE